MGDHSRGARPRVRSALAAVVLGTAGVVGAVGTANAVPASVPETPCTAAARACVDLAAKQAWLIADGAVSRGPVPISSGGPGQETPTGDFRVEWKNSNHRSSEFDGAPMPFAVFFAEGGIAFHEGSVDSPSAGCVHLGHEDATYFYDFLQVGDPVQVR
jgi:L,D-transpeptidase catalytic domain